MCLGLFTYRRWSGAAKSSAPSARPIYHTKNTSTSTISSSSKSEESSSTKDTTPPQSPNKGKKPAPPKFGDAVFQQRLAKARVTVAKRHRGDYSARSRSVLYDEKTGRRIRPSKMDFDFGFFDSGGWGDGGGGGGWGGGGGDGGGGGGC